MSPSDAGHASANGRAVRLGAVLDHHQVVALGDLVEPVHVHGVAEQVHGDDRPRPLGDQALDQVEVEVPGLVLGVHRHRHAAVVEGGERGGDVRARAHEDLAAGREPERRDREVQRGRAARTATPWRAPT